LRAGAVHGVAASGGGGAAQAGGGSGSAGQEPGTAPLIGPSLLPVPLPTPGTMLQPVVAPMAPE
jgi:hypothetical protein